MEKTLILIKPLGLQNCLIDILRVLRQTGTIVERRLVPVTAKLISAHYAEHKDKPFFPRLAEYYSGQTLMALVLEGTDVISNVRQIVGPSNPREATEDQIRGLVLSRFQDGKDGWRALELVTQGVDNFIHASDSQQAADREIALWFS